MVRYTKEITNAIIKLIKDIGIEKNHKFKLKPMGKYDRDKITICNSVHSFKNSLNENFIAVIIKDKVKEKEKDENIYTIEVYGSNEEMIIDGDCKGLFKIPFIQNFIEIDLTNIRVRPRDCSYMFESERVVTIKFNDIDTSRVSNMQSMFGHCHKLKNVNIDKFDTSFVENMSGLFEDCNIQELDLSNFNTNKVKDMSNMFKNCSALKKINISSFNTSVLERADSMFEGCSSLTELDLSNFKTDSMVGMTRMFSGCFNLEKLDLSQFEFKDVINDVGEERQIGRLALRKRNYLANTSVFRESTGKDIGTRNALASCGRTKDTLVIKVKAKHIVTKAWGFGSNVQFEYLYNLDKEQ